MQCVMQKIKYATPGLIVLLMYTITKTKCGAALEYADVGAVNLR